ncbi:TetR/AcrR family transcriptional regulator [Terrihabitans sp. B22-R8]|uniref:TetR/AcrR family transcriptional regulator n=1 Tax=Terrihabitans sp. B22-R8 TaxID=3425128 RepID=UPI00403C56C0
MAEIADPADAQIESQKRRQIMEGASRVFLSRGFSGASMGEIARIAEVSKGTLYVYFESKEQLFEACVEEKRRVFREQVLVFDPARPLEEELTRFGQNLASFVTTPHVIMAMRAVIGIAEQMPKLSSGFYVNGPERGARVFADYLDGKVKEGALAIPDTYLAALQFIELCQSNLTRPFLFGLTMSPQERETRIDQAVSGAVRLFLRGYAPLDTSALEN